MSDDPPEVAPAEEDEALASIAARLPEPGDLVIDPPEAVDDDERGKP